jgi:hypothetical protein
MDERFEVADNRLDTVALGLTEKIDTSQAEVLESVQGLAQHMDERFESVEVSLIEKMDANQVEVLESVQGLAQHMDERFVGVEREQGRMRAVMVTKGYLDEKLANQYADLVLHTDRKIEKALG